MMLVSDATQIMIVLLNNQLMERILESIHLVLVYNVLLRARKSIAKSNVFRRSVDVYEFDNVALEVNEHVEVNTGGSLDEVHLDDLKSAGENLTDNDN